MRYTFLGIGNPFYDRTAYVDTLPEGLTSNDVTITQNENETAKTWSDATSDQKSVKWSLGGSCTNVIKALAQLDHVCALRGMIGADRSEETYKRLRDLKVTPFLKTGENKSGYVNCFVTSNGHRTMHAYLGASDEFTQAVVPEHFKGVLHVHMEGYLAGRQVLQTCIEKAREAQAQISLDLSSKKIVAKFRKELLECAQRVDYVFGNIHEMEALTQKNSVQEMMDAIGNHPTIVITNGEHGGWVRAKKSTEIVPFQAVSPHKLLDSTGAGDFFIAGFLHGCHQDLPLPTCAHLGATAASFIIEREGTNPTTAEWEIFRTLL